jgi:UTP-glucose-1-phosphate uridylyltransferase
MLVVIMVDLMEVCVRDSGVIIVFIKNKNIILIHFKTKIIVKNNIKKYSKQYQIHLPISKQATW